MKLRSLIMALLGSTSILACSAQGGRPPYVPLWPAGAPGAKGTEVSDVPALSRYDPPADIKTGATIIVCPGGGYGGLAEHEGHPIAEWLNKSGVTAFILRYRLAPKYMHPTMQVDVQRAIRTVRANAVAWGLKPDKIGILGFSAGGHLASTAATHFDEGNPSATDPVDKVSSRPDVAVLCYPVITMTTPYTHMGSRNNLLGQNPSADLVDLMSNEKQVTAKTPPTFIFHTAEDQAVPAENALMFATALSKNKVPYELHLYEKGRHGVGLATDDPVLSTWPGRCIDFLRSKGFAK